ncbi:hypothetical protein MUN35_06845 [Hafnia paralvei]|nr:Rap1a/Tai family immunity protein [Hafnia paralvei]MCK2179411.1 hypothetical protein [Hafnia paralvei]
MRTIVLAACFMLSFPACAGFISGNDLYGLYKAYKHIELDSATDKDFRDANEYMGYVTGVSDALDGFVYCPPSGITRGQLSDMVGQYIDKNPDIRHHSASNIMMIYLSDKYPCTKPK